MIIPLCFRLFMYIYIHVQYIYTHLSIIMLLQYSHDTDD